MSANCPECKIGTLMRRPTGWYSCAECGKLVIDLPPDKPVVEPQVRGGIEVAGEPAKPPENWEASALPAPPINIPGGIQVPDYTEVMIGWRAWDIQMRGHTPILRSVSHSSCVWLPGEAVQAECNKGGVMGDHPNLNCSCGLYSARTREHLLTMNYHRYDPSHVIRVMGAVSLWGKVVQGSQGWRSQFGYPRKLFVPYEAFELAGPLQESYLCEVTLDNILKNPDNKKGAK
jgi:hypothetical protein